MIRMLIVGHAEVLVILACRWFCRLVTEGAIPDHSALEVLRRVIESSKRLSRPTLLAKRGLCCRCEPDAADTNRQLSMWRVRIAAGSSSAESPPGIERAQNLPNLEVGGHADKTLRFFDKI
jgi:hypothetical protein